MKHNQEFNGLARPGRKSEWKSACAWMLVSELRTPFFGARRNNDSFSPTDDPRPTSGASVPLLPSGCPRTTGSASPSNRIQRSVLLPTFFCDDEIPENTRLPRDSRGELPADKKLSNFFVTLEFCKLGCCDCTTVMYYCNDRNAYCGRPGDMNWLVHYSTKFTLSSIGGPFGNCIILFWGVWDPPSLHISQNHPLIKIIL